MSIPRFPILLAAISIALCSLSSAQLRPYNVCLTGTQEVPVVITTARANARVVVDLASASVTITGTFSGLSGAATAAHIHGAAPIGVNAGVINGLTVLGGTNGSFSGTFIATPAELNAIIMGQTYLNLHSTVNPGGELRGQVAQFVNEGRLAELLTDPALTDSGGNSGFGPKINNAAEPFNVNIDCSGALGNGIYFVRLNQVFSIAPISTAFGFVYGVGAPLMTFSGPHFVGSQDVVPGGLVLPPMISLVGFEFMAQGFCTNYPGGTRTSNGILQSVGI